MQTLTKIAIKTGFFVVILVLSPGAVFSQQTTYSDRCTVVLVDMTGMKPGVDWDNKLDRKPIELGSFDTVISEEELTTKSFRLPKTNLYVVASVWYTDESMAGDDSQDSMALQLLISPTPKRDVLSGFQFAEAEVLSKNFEVVRVSTIYKIRRRNLYLTMECRKHTRPKR